MKLKKIVSLLLVLVLSVSTYIPAFAASNYKKAADDNKAEIGELLKGAKLIKVDSIGQEGLLFEKEDIIPRSDYSINANSNTTNHKKSIIQIVPENSEAKDRLLEQASEYNALSTDSNYRQTWDTSITVQIFTTVYYTTTSDNFIAIDHITGGYITSGLNGTTIIENSLAYGQIGWANGGFKSQSASKSFGVSTKNWTVYGNSSWVPVSADNTTTVGATYSVEMQRPGGSTWYVELTNNI